MAWQNAKVMLLEQPIATLASHKIMRYRRFEGLNIAQNSGMPPVTIKVQS